MIINLVLDIDILQLSPRVFSDTIKFYLLFFRYNQILPPDNGQNCSTNPDDNVILQQRIDSENY